MTKRRDVFLCEEHGVYEGVCMFCESKNLRRSLRRDIPTQICITAIAGLFFLGAPFILLLVEFVETGGFSLFPLAYLLISLALWFAAFCIPLAYCFWRTALAGLRARTVTTGIAEKESRKLKPLEGKFRMWCASFGKAPSICAHHEIGYFGSCPQCAAEKTKTHLLCSIVCSTVFLGALGTLSCCLFWPSQLNAVSKELSEQTTVAACAAMLASGALALWSIAGMLSNLPLARTFWAGEHVGRQGLLAGLVSEWQCIRSKHARA